MLVSFNADTHKIKTLTVDGIDKKAELSADNKLTVKVEKDTVVVLELEEKPATPTTHKLTLTGSGLSSNQVNLNEIEENTEVILTITKAPNHVDYVLKVDGVEVVYDSATLTYKFNITKNTEAVLTSKDLTSQITALEDEWFMFESNELNLDGKLNIESPATVDSVKAKLEEKLDTTILTVEVSLGENPGEYKVILVSIEDNRAKVENTLLVEEVVLFTLTLPANVVLVSPALPLDKIPGNTEVTIQVNTPTGQTIKELKVDGVNVPLPLIDNKHTFTMNSSVEVTVVFELSAEEKGKVDAELNKVTTPLEVVKADGNVTADFVKTEIEKIVDTTVVNVTVTEIATGYKVELSHKSGEYKVSKEIEVTVAKVTVTIDFGTHATFNGSSTVEIEINKSAVFTQNQIPKIGDADFVLNHASGGFTGYTLEGVTYTFADPVNNNITLVAVFEESVVNVKFETEAEVLEFATFNKTVTVSQNNPVGNPGTPIKPGFLFDGWYNKATNTKHDFANIVTADITLEARFETNSYLKTALSDDGTFLVIIGLVKQVDVVYIPESLGGKEIRSIAHRVFSKFGTEESKSVKEVHIVGNKLVEIGNFAFFDISLSKITLGEGVKYIGEYAFAETSLSEIAFPESITYIGNKAFAIDTLETVSFPANFRSIAKKQFENSKWLQDGVNTSPTKTLIVNNVLVDMDTTNSQVIPNTVQYIGEAVFKNKNVTNITFPNTIIEIGAYAFQEATLPTIFTLPNTIKYIGFKSFAKAKDVTEIKFADGTDIKEIRPYAFTEMPSLTTFNIPNGLKVISEGTFYKSENLLTFINEAVVEKIYKKAFRGTAWWTGRNKQEFYIFNNILIWGARTPETAEIPSTVTRIAEDAFRDTFNNATRKTIVIPSTVQTIDSFAFNGNNKFETITISPLVNTVSENAFFLFSYYEAPTKLTLIVSDVETRPAGWAENWYKVTEESFRLKKTETGYNEQPINLIDRFELLWSPVVTVKFDLNGGTSTLPTNSVQILKGESIAIPEFVPELTGKYFIGWLRDGVPFTFDQTFTKSETLVANYVDNNADYTVRYEKEEFHFVELLNSSLATFDIPNLLHNLPVVGVDNNAFNNKEALTTVNFPENILAIGAELFTGSANVETITFGIKVKDFGKDAFKGTKFLTNARTNDTYLIINGVLVDAKMANAVVTMPLITKINRYAFAETTTATEVTFIDGLDIVATNAFTGVSGLTKIVLPSTALHVQKDAFAIGSAETIQIDCQAVSHVTPPTWEAGYDNGAGATLNFVWEYVETQKITLVEYVTLEDTTLVPDFIIKNSTIVLLIAVRPNLKVKSLTINGVEKVTEITPDNKLSLVMDTDKVVAIEYTLSDEKLAEFNQEFNKLQDKMGYELMRQTKELSILQMLGEVLNTSVVTPQITEVNPTTYNIRLVSAIFNEFHKDKENVNLVTVVPVSPDYLTATGTSGTANSSSEGMDKIVDGYESKKWCDNGGATVKYVDIQLTQPMFVSKFRVVHAGIAESASMNTGAFKILVGATKTNMTTVVDVYGNVDTRTAHSFPGQMIQFIRFESTWGEKVETGHVTRVYELYVLAETSKLVGQVTFDYAGGKDQFGDTSRTYAVEAGAYMPTAYYADIQLNRNYHDFTFWNPSVKNYMNPDQITGDRTHTAQWEADPSVGSAVSNSFDLLKEKNFVESTEAVLTTEMVQAYVESIMDPTKVSVTVTHDANENYKVKLTHTIVTDYFEERTFKFFIKAPGQQGQITFNFNGGNLEGDLQRVVSFDLGYTLTGDDILVPTRNNYTLSHWTNLGNPITLNGYIVDGDMTVVAIWQIVPEIGGAMSEELSKIPGLLGVTQAGDAETLEEVETRLSELLDPAICTFVVTKTGTKQYEIELTSVVQTDYKISKSFEMERRFTITIPTWMAVHNQGDHEYVLRGDLLEIKLNNPEITNVTNLVVVGGSFTQDGDIITIDPVDGNVVVTADLVNDDAKIQKVVDRVLGNISDQIVVSDLTGLNAELAKEAIIAQFDTEGLNIEVAPLYTNAFKVTVAHPENLAITNEKDVLFVKSVVMSGVFSPLYGGNYYSGWEASTNENAKHVWDEDNTTYWQDTENNFVYFGMGIVGKKEFTLRIYNAEAAGLDANLNTRHFKIHGVDSTSDSKYKGSSSSGWTLLAEVTNNTLAVTEILVKAPADWNNEWTMIIEIVKGTQTDDLPATIAGIEPLDKEKPKQITFNLNGGNVAGNTENLTFAYSADKIDDTIIPNVVQDGKTFAGWLVEGTENVLTNEQLKELELTAGENVVLVAQWT